MYLLFTVLKHCYPVIHFFAFTIIATVLTACGIETINHGIHHLLLPFVATVLTAYDIDTYICNNL